MMKNTTNSTTAIIGLSRGGDIKFALDFDFSEAKQEEKRKIKILRVRPHPLSA